MRAEPTTVPPEGEYVLVPREPTEMMLSDARDWSILKYGKAVGNDGTSGCYRAMLAARPRHLDEVRRKEEAVFKAADELTRMHHEPCGFSRDMGFHCYICAVKDALAALRSASREEKT